MKKNFNKNLFLILVLINLIGISTILTSDSFINSTGIYIHEVFLKDFKQLPYTSQNLVWNENGSQVCVKPLEQYDHRICNDGMGGAIVTWFDMIDYLTTGWDIYAQHIDSNGIIQWGINGTAICTAENNQVSPDICSDGVGGAIITWLDYRGGIDLDIYVQHIDSNGILQWSNQGTVICNSSYDQLNSRICSDGEGGAIIAWEDERNGNWDIYAQRIDSSGNLLWNTNGTVICTESSYQGLPVICSDGVGGAIITWNDERNGNSDIYAQRIDSNGGVLWEGNGAAVCTANDDQEGYHICSDGAEGAIIAWQDMRNGDFDIYIQCISGSDGISQWDDNGTAICTAADDQSDLQITSNGAGGAIIAWRDKRGTLNYDIYAQRIDLNGTVQWVNNGKAICTIDENQGVPYLCSDGAGGAIITWNDYRSGSKNDIYAQRVDLNGDIKWLVNGIPICIADDTRYEPRIITEGAGTAIIVWLDLRNGNRDLYAQKLENPPPTSDHPSDITTTIGGSETINWTLVDDFGSGNYRVLANDTNDDDFVWVDWTSWTNNTVLHVPINRSNSGYFRYTIQYYDDQHNSGFPDTVIVQIMEPEGGISGYSFFILLSCSLGLILIITKRLKHSGRA